MSDSFSIDDVNTDQLSSAVEKRTIPWHWVVLGLMLVANAPIGVYYSPLNRVASRPEEPDFIMIGFLTVQPVFFSLWAAFTLQPLFQRLLWSFFVCTSMAFFEDLAAWKLGIGDLGDNLTFLPQVYLIASIILLLIRLLFGWRIIRLNSHVKPVEYRDYQFGLKHLMLLITFAAVVFSFFRFLVTYNRGYNVSVGTKQACVFFVSISALLLPAFIIIFTILSKKSFKVFPVFILILLLVIGSVISVDILNILHVMLRERIPYILALFVAGTCISATLNSVVLRMCGYRLIRGRKSPSSLQVPGQ
jgi:hypothetical protein